MASSLLDALLAVQREAPTLPKNKTNPHFKSKYTPLDTIVETIGPILNRHGLVWITLPTTNEHGQPALLYRLIHVETQDDISGTMPLLPGKADSQALGSAITYARRYSLCALLNLVADDDDDGHAARAAVGGGRVDQPSDRQLTYLRQLVTKAHASTGTLRMMLDAVGGQGIEVKEGWTRLLTRDQASALIEAFKGGTLPDPEAHDIPVDPPSDSAADESTDDLPFDEETS